MATKHHSRLHHGHDDAVATILEREMAAGQTRPIQPDEIATALV